MKVPTWGVETPIDTFEHPETDSVIDIVSLVHVGQPSYYRELGEYIMGRQDEGFAVHYESVAVGGEEATEPRGALIRAKNWLLEEFYEAEADAFVTVELNSSYTIQANGVLFRPEGSYNYDVDDAFVTEHASLFKFILEFGKARVVRKRLASAAKQGSGAVDEYVFNKLKDGVSESVGPKAERHAKRDKVIVGARNEVALAGVDHALEADTDAKLVLVWGVGHLAGLSAGLVARSYTHSHRQGVQAAFSLPAFVRESQQQGQELQRLQTKVNRFQAKVQKKAGLR